jgi:hypothetical protein
VARSAAATTATAATADDDDGVQTIWTSVLARRSALAGKSDRPAQPRDAQHTAAAHEVVC